MGRSIGFVIIMLVFLLQTLACYAADSNSGQNDPSIELEYDHLTPHFKRRRIDTESLHILKNISESAHKSTYFGLTITHAYGYVSDKSQDKDNSAVGIGPIYMIRNEGRWSGKLYGALDMSGGFILYNNPFPADGRAYNFMWRIGPRLIYKISDNNSLNVGYTWMHVSNGLKTHNTSYDAGGISLGYEMKF